MVNLVASAVECAVEAFDPDRLEASEGRRPGVHKNGVPGCGGAGVNVVGEYKARALGGAANLNGSQATDALQAIDVGDLVGVGGSPIAAEQARERAAADAEVIGLEGRQVCRDLIPIAALENEGADVDCAGRGNG